MRYFFSVLWLPFAAATLIVLGIAYLLAKWAYEVSAVIDGRPDRLSFREYLEGL
jgi:hypothetical protein